MRGRGLGVAGVAVASAALMFAPACTEKPHRVAPSASSAPIDTVAETLASAAPSGSAIAADGGAPDAHVDAGPPKPARPRVKVIDAPEETRSPLPKVAEWTDVPRRAVVNHGIYECTMQHVREWHRITCSCTNSTVALTAGTRDGVSVWSTTTEAQLFFPIRRGDARVFEVTPHSRFVVVPNAGPYGQGVSEEEGGPTTVISEAWLEGEDAPTIVVQ